MFMLVNLDKTVKNSTCCIIIPNHVQNMIISLQYEHAGGGLSQAEDFSRHVSSHIHSPTYLGNYNYHPMPHSVCSENSTACPGI
jgi:hypothetical protein